MEKLPSCQTGQRLRSLSGSQALFRRWSHTNIQNTNIENGKIENNPNAYKKVAWHLDANHVGGYAFRLCKMPVGGLSELTEECFQQNHLDFVGDHQWVEFNEKPDERVELPAVRTREGTFPPNSQWAKSPIEYNGERNSASHIFDYVEVPVDLVPGQYVLSFRWDCQATPQIWNACANINII